MKSLRPFTPPANAGLLHVAIFTGGPCDRQARGRTARGRAALRPLALALGLAIALGWGASTALARNPDISFWTHNLSGDEPADETWTDSNNEIAVVGQPTANCSPLTTHNQRNTP